MFDLLSMLSTIRHDIGTIFILHPYNVNEWVCEWVSVYYVFYLSNAPQFLSDLNRMPLMAHCPSVRPSACLRSFFRSSLLFINPPNIKINVTIFSFAFDASMNQITWLKWRVFANYNILFFFLFGIHFEVFHSVHS